MNQHVILPQITKLRCPCYRNDERNAYNNVVNYEIFINIDVDELELRLYKYISDQSVSMHVFAFAFLILM